MFKLSINWPFVVVFKYLHLEIGGAGKEWDVISYIFYSCSGDYSRLSWAMRYRTGQNIYIYIYIYIYSYG